MIFLNNSPDITNHIIYYSPKDRNEMTLFTTGYKKKKMLARPPTLNIPNGGLFIAR